MDEYVTLTGTGRVGEAKGRGVARHDRPCPRPQVRLAPWAPSGAHEAACGRPRNFSWRGWLVGRAALAKSNGVRRLWRASRVGVPRTALSGGCGSRQNTGSARAADGAAEAGCEGEKPWRDGARASGIRRVSRHAVSAVPTGSTAGARGRRAVVTRCVAERAPRPNRTHGPSGNRSTHQKRDGPWRRTRHQGSRRRPQVPGPGGQLEAGRLLNQVLQQTGAARSLSEDVVAPAAPAAELGFRPPSPEPWPP